MLCCPRCPPAMLCCPHCPPAMLCCPHCPPAMLCRHPVTPSSSDAVLSSLSSSDAVLSSRSSSDAVLSSLSSSEAVLSSQSSSDAVFQGGGSLLTSPVWCSPPHSPNGLPQQKARPVWLTDFWPTRKYTAVPHTQIFTLLRWLPPPPLSVCALKRIFLPSLHRLAQHSTLTT